MSMEKNIKKILENNDDNSFFVRIRTNNNKIIEENKIVEKTEITNSEVYYMGFKVLDKVGDNNIIDENESFKKFFRFNSTNINKSEIDPNELKKYFKTARKKFYNKFVLESISFNFGTDEIITLKLKEAALEELNRYLKGPITKDYKGTIINVKDNITLDEEYELAKILYKYYVRKKSNVFKEVRFNYNKDLKTFNRFDDDLKDRIKYITEGYERITKTELEKKYQHEFLIKVKELDYGKTLIPFEEEYNIEEEYTNNGDGKGRIDCIFYSLKENVITDIYLIEIKINETVLGKENGIHKHLYDIKKICENIKYDAFKEKIIERINNRNEIIDKNIEKYTADKNLKMHFCIVIGTSKDEFDLEQYIDDLNDINSSLYKSVKIKGIDNPKILRELLKDINLDIRLYEDKNKWKVDGSLTDFNPKFENRTDLMTKNEQS